MRRRDWRYDSAPVNSGIFIGGAQRSRRYGLSSFMGDCLLTALTGGLWLIWVVIREIAR